MEGKESTYGFCVNVPNCSIEDLICGRIEIVARTEVKGEIFEQKLPIWHILRIAEQLSKLKQFQASTVNNWIDTIAMDAPIRLVTTSKEEGILTTGFGQTSYDGDVVVGRNGFLFLGRGANKVLNLYIDEYPGKKILWNRLFWTRSNALNNRGIGYCQIILPEKSSVLGEYCPFATQRPSLLMREVITPTDIPFPTQIVAPFLSDEQCVSTEMYLRTDSHLSTNGAFTVVKDILKSMGFEFPRMQFDKHKRLLKGDLGSRFPGDQKELVEVIDLIRVNMVTMSPVLIDAADPTSGHKGIRRVWRNQQAPFNMTVVAMANSFFERGVMSTQLSWWFCRLFTEFHFCWNPRLDFEYIDKVNPNFVICQTIERFLRVVPDE